MTKSEKLAELQEERIVARAALLKAYKAKSYTIADRQKSMQQVSELRELIKEIDREIIELNRETTGIRVNYGVPE